LRQQPHRAHQPRHRPQDQSGWLVSPCAVRSRRARSSA
jgi:hypothetical protein